MSDIASEPVVNYWDVKESKIVQPCEMAKAGSTGRPPTDMGEHGVVRMN